MKRIDKTTASSESDARVGRNLPAAELIASSASSYKGSASGTNGICNSDGSVGKFVDGSYTNHAGTRSYKLYVPGTYRGQSLPLIVMLHGCSQNPDDFAAGTRMNAIAEENKCFVLYPAQAESANRFRCWNWFVASNQKRNLGEPSIIAGLTRDIINTFHINKCSVFIAGLSSGGAMSAIMGTTYPDLFAAVGIHSGLPYASARNFSSAMEVMQNGNGGRQTARQTSWIFFPARKALPTIVFHGDRDTTVHPSNADQIIAQSVSNAAHHSPRRESASYPYITVGQGKVANGRSYTHSVHRDDSGRVIAEHWIVHGAGHAWSGGSSLGSFTDPMGPDAGREMLRFFLARS